jgi:hypothetical protein
VETTSKPENAQRLVALASFQQLLLMVVKSCAAIDIRGYELASVPRLLTELRPALLKLLAEGRSLISSLLELCELLQRSYPGVRSMPPQLKSDGDDRRFERAVDAAVASARVSFAAVEEVAFMAQLELGQRADRLERVLPNCDAATLLGECDSSLRRLRKSLNAVGLTIARVINVPPLAEYRSELDSSLAIRRALKSFRVRVNKGGEPTPDKLRERFRYIANQIEILVSWDIYSGMRVRDRLLLRSLQQRVLAWLNGIKPAPEAGMRLWQDLAACVEMFALVNRRQELVEHDSALFSECVTALKVQASDARVDGALWRRVRAVEGLDLELDALLEQPSEPQVQVLLSLLERLVARSSPPPQDDSSAGEMW